MSNKETIKIGVIGVGYLGEFHVQQLQQIDNVELIGVSDFNHDRLSEICNKYDISDYEKQSDLFPLCDGIIIATPTSTHYQIAKEALNGKCHIFIEKPITKSTKEAEELIRFAEQNKLLIQVGHIERFNPAFIELKTKQINPQFIEVHRLASFKYRGHDTSVVLDLMIHDIDIILDIVDSDVDDIQANGVKVITEETDIANARIKFKNGCIANLTSSRISLKKMRKMRIFQERSYMNIDFLDKTLEEYSLVDNNQELEDGSQIFPYDDVDNRFIKYRKNDKANNNALLDELKHFTGCIQTSVSPAVDGAVGVAALNIALIIQDKINDSQ